MKKLDLKIWYICNNNCDFCIQWEEKRKKYIPRTLDEIKNILYNEFQKKARFLTITGWEPTLHNTLIPTIRYAKSLWYLSINIQSNGQNFSNINLCKALVSAWANLFEPSIHWFKKETHDFLVKTSWAWEKVVLWIMNLKKLWQKVIINSVITKQNYKEIPKLALFLVKLKVNYFQFAFPHIWGSAMKNWREIIPTKTEVMPYIKMWLDIAREAWIEARTEAIPFCFMQWYEYALTEQYLVETSVFDEAYILNSFNDYRKNQGKRKQEKCKTCIMFYKCEGPWKEYPDLFWWDEFIPIN